MKKTFSWRTAIGHAAAAVAVVLVLGIILAAVVDLENPRAAGRVIGSSLPLVICLALGVSYMVQTGVNRLLVGVVVLLVALGVSAGVLLQRRDAARALSAAERAPLVIEGEGATRRLRHPTLGYSLALPADLEPLPGSLTAGMSKDPGVTGTAWGNTSSGRVFILLLSSVRSEAELRAFMDGVTDSQDALARQSGDGVTVTTLRDELRWSGASGEAHRHVAIGNSHARFDAFGSAYGEGRVLTIGLFSFSRDDDSFAELASTLRVH
jgi:hypothetical protein